MTTEEPPNTVFNQSSTNILTTQVTTDSSDSIDTSILGIKSPIIILIWFEIIAACLVYGLGFIGNLLSLIVFYSLDEFRRISTGSFFLYTTISNTIHLWTLSTDFLGVYNVNIYPNAFLQCRLSNFVENSSRALSTYLAVGIALDRFIRSELPLRSRRICTRRNAIIYTFICVISFSLLWAIWFSPTIARDPITSDCIYTASATVYFYLVQVQTPVRLVVVCIIPVIVMTAANIRMLYNMRQSHRRVQNQIEINTVMTTRTSTVTSNSTARRMSAIDRMLFYMMLANVFTFIITQIPFHTYTTIRSYYRTLDPFTNSLIRAILLIWSSLYFGVAFYLYCFASPLFRKKFIVISKRIINFVKPRHT